MDALLTAIMLWISANYGLSVASKCPQVERVPTIAMTALRQNGPRSSLERETSVLQTQESSHATIRDVVAVYDDRTRTIYLSDDWSGATPAELSVLVHEIVHHLQNEAGYRYECPAEREKLAYDVQEKWLGLFGRNLESEFGINGLALLISTSCAMASGLH